MLSSLSQVTVNLTEGSLIMSNFTSFLPEAIEVTGAILVSMGECGIQGPLSMNVSLRAASPSKRLYLQQDITIALTLTGLNTDLRIIFSTNTLIYSMKSTYVYLICLNTITAASFTILQQIL